MNSFIKIAVILAVIGAMLLPGMGRGAEASTPWVIDGEKVYVDDENVYLSATPHTLIGSGWVEFELQSKHYEGEIDIIWGFDTSAGVSPRSPQVWADNVPHEEERWVEVEREGKATFEGLISYEPLEWGSADPDIGNENNAYLGRLIGFSLDIGDFSIVIAFNSFINPTPTSATFYYNYTWQEKEYYIEYYPDFRDFSVPDLTIVQRSYMGVDSWHFAKLGFLPVKDTTYKVRVWVDAPFTGLDKFTSKYVWGVKPHRETIQEAIDSGHLYLLDPWLAGGWDHRVELTIDKDDVDSALSNFPVLLYLSTSSGNNSADVSFIFDELTNDANRKKIAVTTADGETQCYVEIERWVDADEEAWLWVKVPSVSDVADTILYLYYDVDHADNDAYVGDPNSVPAENVWDSDFVFVSHMRDDPDTSHIRDSSTSDNDGTKVAANNPIVTAELLGESQDFVADDYLTTGVTDFVTGIYTVEVVVKPDFAYDTGSNYRVLEIVDTDVVRCVDLYYVQGWDQWAGLVNVATYAKSPAQTFAAEDIMSLALTTNAAVESEMWANGIKGVTNSTTWTPLAPTEVIIGIYKDKSSTPFDGVMDEIRISKAVRADAWITASHESNRDDLISFGSEEDVPPSAPTNVSATDSTHTDKVVITWDASAGATKYEVFRDAGGLGATGNVTTYDDSGADAPTITGGNAVATDGDHTDKVSLSLAGTSSANGTVHSYTVKAGNADGWSAASGADNGNRGVGALGYQWEVDRGAGWGDIGGATGATYDDASAPAGIITPGTGSASDGASTAHITLSVAGESVADGATNEYRCKLTATGAAGQTSGANTGYRTTGAITYAWQVSAADSDAAYGALGGATTDPYNDTTAPANGDGRWYYCEVSATGTTTQDSTHNRGYRAAAPTITTGLCTGFDELWAIVNGNIADEGTSTVTIVGFEYGLSTSYGANITDTGSWTTGDDFWAKLTPLTPATVYHYRALAYNGFWGYGSDRQFSTEGSPALYEYLNTGGDGDSGAIFSANWTAEQFTSDNVSHSVTSIRVPLKRVGTYPGTVELAITHADSDNFSTGADLSSMLRLGNTMSDTAYVWYDFDIPDIILDASSKYTIVVRATGGNATDYILWQKDSGGALADAQGSHSMDSGISWITDAPTDYLFEIWGEPVLDLEEAKVFMGYIEEGDWLITLLYENTYAPYYPDQDPASYFYIQLVDGTTVKAQVACPAWGYRPGSIYLAKATADTLEWGAAYKVRLYGDFGINPVVEYVLTAADWRGSELTFLDSWVLLQAGVIGAEDEVELTVDVGGGDEVLNAEGTVVFTKGIAGLSDARPNLFEISYHKPEMEDTDFPGAMQAATDWETRLGATIAGHLTDIGALVNTDGKSVGGFFVLLIFIAFIIGGAILGNMVAGMIVGYLPLLGGAWVGVIDYVLLGVITFFAACIFVYQVFLKR